MPSSICCTNCRTKYSMLNREAGCSKCAKSFCKKCLGYRAILPNLSPQPMIVCYNCYQALEAAKLKPEAIITSSPLPAAPRPGGSSQKNWWGDGLPPPSFRQTYGNSNASTSQFRPTLPQKPVVQPDYHISTEDLEQRRAKLRPETIKEPLSVEEIEERLARLRGCDVEQIRNPKSWLHSSSANDVAINASTPADLIRQAQDRARIEEKEEEAERKDLEELEARKRRIFEMDEHGKETEVEGSEGGGVRESVVSGETEFSEATKEEMNEINNLLVDAEKRVAETRKQEEHDSAELRTLMRNTRQKSLDAMQWNEKITKEIGGFWNKQNEKGCVEQEEDDDEKSLDEETFKKILYEAENSEDVPVTGNTSTSPEKQPEESPKKKGFFGKFFRKDSKH